MINKSDYIFRWHRFQQRHENIFTRKFKDALQIQVDQFAKRGNPQDISSTPIYLVLKELYQTVGPLWAARTGIHRLHSEVKALMPMGFSQRIVDLMKQYYGIDLLNDAELMTAYSREVLVKVLSDAAISGISFDQIVRELLVNPEFSEMRARRIARTETVTAANGAAIINAKESGLLMNKEWIAIEDKRTRHTHRAVDGVTIPIDDAFNVGGSLMTQPGVRTQTNGLPTPAGEVVNCRCTTGFIPVRRGGKLVRA